MIDFAPSLPPLLLAMLRLCPQLIVQTSLFMPISLHNPESQYEANNTFFYFVHTTLL
jgi:hypothetical protein